jgi:hypothetical protein
MTRRPSWRDARYVLTGEHGEAEFALTVADAWQHRGLGPALMQHLRRHARRHGVSRLVGDVLRTNPAMLRLGRRMGGRFAALPGRGHDHARHFRPVNTHWIHAIECGSAVAHPDTSESFMTAHLLQRNQILRFDDALDARIECSSGFVWVTIDGDIRDIVLSGGDSFVVDSDAPVIVQAIKGVASLRLCSATTAA